MQIPARNILRLVSNHLIFYYSKPDAEKQACWMPSQEEYVSSLEVWGSTVKTFASDFVAPR